MQEPVRQVPFREILEILTPMRTAPADGTRMKIWQCFDNLPAQQWFWTTDARIALFNKGACESNIAVNGLVN